MIEQEDLKEAIQFLQYMNNQMDDSKLIIDIIMKNILKPPADIEAQLLYELNLASKGIKPVEQLMYAYSYVEFADKFMDNGVPINICIDPDNNNYALIDGSDYSGQLDSFSIRLENIFMDLYKDHKELQMKNFSYDIKYIGAEMDTEQIIVRVEKTYKVELNS